MTLQLMIDGLSKKPEKLEQQVARAAQLRRLSKLTYIGGGFTLGSSICRRIRHSAGQMFDPIVPEYIINGSDPSLDCSIARIAWFAGTYGCQMSGN